MLNKLGRLGQSLQPGCDGEYVASGAIRLTRRDVGDGQMRRRDSAIAPVVTKGPSRDGEVVAPCLELARARHGSKINGTKSHKCSEPRASHSYNMLQSQASSATNVPSRTYNIR